MNDHLAFLRDTANRLVLFIYVWTVHIVKVQNFSRLHCTVIGQNFTPPDFAISLKCTSKHYSC